MKDTAYWLYLEPYTFIFKNEKAYLIYNTLNSACIKSEDFEGVEDVLNELHNSPGYSIGVSEERLSDKALTAFIQKIRDTYSGDFIKKTTNVRPFIFKPILRLHNHPDNLKIKEENLLGLNILHYLHEVSFYLDGKCEDKCSQCKSYFQQFNHCTKGKSQILREEDYQNVLDQLYISQLDKINIITPYLTHELVGNIIHMARKLPFKKVVTAPYREGLFENINHPNDEKFSYRIMVSFPIDIVEIRAQMETLVEKDITWVFIISSEKELFELENADFPSNIKIEYLPYYDGGNSIFFEKYVFTDLSDITEAPIAKQVIFRRQVLNENFFGKLSVFPGGSVYSNHNYPLAGNVLENKLTEIVYNEVTQIKSWFRTRNEGRCKTCLYNCLCPSPSNYELVMNKYDLCHVD